MKLAEREKTAITTVINLAFDICEETPNDRCNECPFWSYCKHADESIPYYLNHLFEKMLDKES